MNSILESVGYLAILVCSAVGVIVIIGFAWVGAHDILRRIERANRFQAVMANLRFVPNETTESPYLRKPFDGPRTN